MGRKLRAQTAVWRGAGHESVLALAARPFADPLSERQWKAVGAVVEPLSPATGALRKEVGRHRTGCRLAQEIAAWGPDAVYVRFGPYHLGEEMVLRSGRPVILEFNTDDLAEYRDRRPLYWYHRATRLRLLRGAALAFAPTAKIAAAMSPLLRCEVLILPNGAETSDVAVLAPNQGAPAIAFIAGSDSPRQGVDKVLRLAALLDDVHFHLIGPLSAITDLPNVTFHGQLPVDRYRWLLQRCDVALGTLALHRVGMEEAAPLKVREYLAHGLPVVIAHKDPDGPLFDRWALRIPNSEDNVETHARAIHQFLRGMHGVRVPAGVGKQLGHDAKEGHRLAAVESVVSAGRGRT